MTRQIGPSVTAVPGGSGPRSGSTEAAFQCVNLGGGGGIYTLSARSFWYLVTCLPNYMSMDWWLLFYSTADKASPSLFAMPTLSQIYSLRSGNRVVWTCSHYYLSNSLLSCATGPSRVISWCIFCQVQQVILMHTWVWKPSCLPVASNHRWC